ncbi:MAG TPA: hypothetical protein VHW26_05010 [Solirubrobacteraceae bacterium]|nr:hypothetical protein [Solirubrobacteraceae bacterium]
MTSPNESPRLPAAALVGRDRRAGHRPAMAAVRGHPGTPVAPGWTVGRGPDTRAAGRDHDDRAAGDGAGGLARAGVRAAGDAYAPDECSRVNTRLGRHEL